MPLDLPTFATDFELSSLANLSSFRKHYPTTIVGTILVRAWRLSAVHDRAIDHQIYAGTLERLARFLSFLFLLLFFSLTLGGRRCVIVARLSLYRAHGAQQSAEV